VSLKPMTIQIPENDVADLRLRLKHTRWPPPVESGVSERVEVPTAVMMPLRDGVTVPAPREWAERSYNVRRWTVVERGGHFPEWEVPHLAADDIRLFFAAVT
jgi:pimeloyl-ACP methyl ester carboxylesterase